MTTGPSSRPQPKPSAWTLTLLRALLLAGIGIGLLVGCPTGVNPPQADLYDGVVVVDAAVADSSRADHAAAADADAAVADTAVVIPGFGDPCSETDPCSSLDCVSTAGQQTGDGFCSVPCTEMLQACAGTPPSTRAVCAIKVPDGWRCGFVCRVEPPDAAAQDYACPGQMSCSPTGQTATDGTTYFPCDP